jgi:transposase-like protein
VPKKSDAQFHADDIAARRRLLGIWLDRLRDAESLNQRQREKVGRGDVPDLTMPYPSRDMLNLLVSGIKAALSGSNDPFGIRQRRGVKLRQDWSAADRIEAIQEVARRADKIGKVTAAIDEVAKERKVSFGTLRKNYYDKRMRMLAGLESHPLWAESNRRLHSRK